MHEHKTNSIDIHSKTRSDIENLYKNLCNIDGLNFKKINKTGVHRFPKYEKYIKRISIFDYDLYNSLQNERKSKYLKCMYLLPSSKISENIEEIVSKLLVNHQLNHRV